MGEHVWPDIVPGDAIVIDGTRYNVVRRTATHLQLDNGCGAGDRLTRIFEMPAYAVEPLARRLKRKAQVQALMGELRTRTDQLERFRRYWDADDFDDAFNRMRASEDGRP